MRKRVGGGRGRERRRERLSSRLLAEREALSRALTLSHDPEIVTGAKIQETKAQRTEPPNTYCFQRFD